MACDGRFTDSHAQMCRLHLTPRSSSPPGSPSWTSWSPRRPSRSPPSSPRSSPSPASGRAPRRSSSPRPAATWPGSPPPPGSANSARLAPSDNSPPASGRRPPVRPGDQHLRAAIVEAALVRCPHRHPARRPVPAAAARRFGRGNERGRGRGRAYAACCIAWAVIKHDQDYAEAGEQYFEQRDRATAAPDPALAQQPWPSSATR